MFNIIMAKASVCSLSVALQMYLIDFFFMHNFDCFLLLEIGFWAAQTVLKLYASEDDLEVLILLLRLLSAGMIGICHHSTAMMCW